jgi:hypothetical protein
LGDTLRYIALVVLVFELTGRGLAVVGLVPSGVVPDRNAGSPPAGMIDERYYRAFCPRFWYDLALRRGR